MDEYKELGLSSSDLNYDFFAKYYHETYLAEIYRICLYNSKRNLSSAHLKSGPPSLPGWQGA